MIKGRKSCLCTSTVQLKYNMSHMYNFKFSNSHLFLKKDKKTQVK